MEQQLSSTRSYLKHYILKHRLIPYKCICGLEGIWQNKHLSLQLDHVDGNNSNNILSNLRFLCPNCHSQTPNFMGHQKKRRSIRYMELVDAILRVIDGCSSCRQLLQKLQLSDHSSQYQKVYRALDLIKDNSKVIAFKHRQTLRQHEPRFIHRKVVNRPSKEELEKLVWLKPSTQIAKDFGLNNSDTILRWCRIYGIKKPSRGYWTKLKRKKILADPQERSGVS